MLNLSVYYNKKITMLDEAKKLIAELKDLGYKIAIEKVSKKTDLVLALGGDGTYLRVAKEVMHCPKPILAVCLGRLGFISEVAHNEVFRSLKKFQEKKFTIDRRYLLDVTICQGEKRIKTEQVLNDAVLTRYGLSRLFDIRVCVGKKETVFRSDGMIIATPTGSTAYNLSAGGPLVDPKKKKIILTPICPHTTCWQSIVVDDKKEAVVIPEVERGFKLALTYDGHDFKKLKKGYFLKVKRSDYYVDFVRFKPYDFDKVFKKKIGSKRIC